ncbi:hypothetical protein QTP86_026590, partial [Hemibagrus guttatus]
RPPVEMHHPELAGDSASTRKMAQAANCPRRASANTAGGSSSVLTPSSGGAILSSNLMPSDDYKPSALIQPLPTAASSLGTQQPPPHTLNIHSQSSLLPPGVPSSGAQIKKKSGFQITSVTPAQISVSTNNSITEDTESCDDLDESHTEDLSSSEILDVSLSRANDAAGPERSSSEDTLNNLHDAETPGAVSPNQPPLLPQTHSAMVNGAVHHHHHHTHHHHQLHPVPSGNTQSASSASGGTQAGIPLASNSQPHQTPMPAPHTTSSRFRVVKLDSTSEPFKKVESIRQFVPDSSERDAVSVSSVSSSVSTLSHYSEGVPSGDGGGSSAVQQSFPPPGHMSEYSMPANVSKPQLHPHKKANTATPVPVSNQQQAPVSMVGLQTTTGHPSPAVPPQQLTYAQAAQLTSAQSVPGVTQQQMAYPPAPQPAAAAQVAPVHVTSLSQGGSRPADFAQTQQIIQVAASGSTQALPHLSTSMAPVGITGNGQVMPPSQPPLGNIPAAVAQSVTQGILQPQQTPQMAQAPTGGVMPQLVQSIGPGVVQQPPKGPQLPTQLSVEQQTPLSSQGIGAQFVPVTSSLPTSNVPLSIQSDPQAGLVQNGSKDGGTQPAVSALYANLPSLVATQLEDAQRLLIQHPSLLAFPKLGAGDCASQTGTSLAPEESGGVSALTASASLLKNLPVDGEEDGLIPFAYITAQHKAISFFHGHVTWYKYFLTTKQHFEKEHYSPINDGRLDLFFSSSGASVVAIDNKIEQAMDLVKSHLMYAVREEVEVLKEQIKELLERNSQLEQENNLLKNLASPEQLAQFQAQVQSGSPPSSTQGAQQSAMPVQQLPTQNSGPSV